MEEKKIPNPKAFPNTDGQTFCEDGMTLRDYFAAKAMQGILGDPDYVGTKEDLSNASYAIADAMLNQRTKQ